MTQVTLAEEGLDTLFGTHDENLRRIERTFDVSLTARGNELHIQGEPDRVQAVERLLSGLTAITERGYRFRPGDVQTAIRVASEAPDTSLTDFFLPKEYDGVQEIGNEDAYRMCKRLNQEESIIAGPSSGCRSGSTRASASSTTTTTAASTC